MKLDRLETHDRLVEFSKQADYISQGCIDCIKGRPKAFGIYPFYIFAHCRTHDNGWAKRLIWEPRMTKPKAQTNSMLFRSYPETDLIKVIWMIPAREQWESYKKGNLLEDDVTLKSINDFQFNRKFLEKDEPDELPKDKKLFIMREVAKEFQSLKEKKKREEMFKDSLKIGNIVNLSH